MIRSIVLSLLITFAFGLTSRADEAVDCMNTARTQSELNSCAKTKADQALAKMTNSFQAVVCHLDGKKKQQLEASQRAWEIFAHADCKFWGGGSASVGPMNAALCFADLATRRATELDTWPPNAPRDAVVPCK